MVKKADRHDRWRNTFYGRVFLTLAKHLENDRQADLPDYVWVLKQELNCSKSQILVALSTTSQLGWTKSYRLAGAQVWAVAITQQGWKAVDDQPALWGPKHVTPPSGQDAWRAVRSSFNMETVASRLLMAAAPFSRRSNTAQEQFLHWMAQEIIRQQQPVIFDHADQWTVVSGRTRYGSHDLARELCSKGLLAHAPIGKGSLCLTAYGWKVLGYEQPPIFPLKKPVIPASRTASGCWLVALRFVAAHSMANVKIPLAALELGLDILLANNLKSDYRNYGRQEVKRLLAAGLLMGGDSDKTMIITDLGWQFLGPKPLIDWPPVLRPSVKLRRRHLTDQGHQLRYLSALADVIMTNRQKFVGIERWPTLVASLGLLKSRIYALETMTYQSGLIARRTGRGLKRKQMAVCITSKGWRFLGLPTPQFKKSC